MRLTVACGLLVVLSALTPAHAETADVIVAERPGFSASAVALDQSRVQVEGGYQYTRMRGREKVDDHTLPFLLLRFGLPKQLELQLAWTGYSWTDISGWEIEAARDAGVALKWQLTEPDAALQLALIPQLQIPVDDSDFGSDRLEPSVSAAWSYSGFMDLFGTVLVSESDGDVSMANAIGINLPVTSVVGAYVELYGSYLGRAGAQHYLNGGFTFLPAGNLQLDLYAGLSLNRGANDSFLGFGLAYRF